MAIIGKIRKHSGLAVIIVGVAIAAFVIGDFGKRNKGSVTNIGSVNGEDITYIDFNNKVDETIEIQKENMGTDKITEDQTYGIRQSTWTGMVRTLVMGEEYSKLGITVSPDELFDQVQGKNPHRYILQYFKDPNTGQYDPALVLNYLKNLDQMEPKAKTQWLQFEKAIKDDRLETKYNNLIAKSYYMPKAFLKQNYLLQAKTLKLRVVSPSFFSISDSAAAITDEDYQKFYEKNKGFFYADEAYREMEYVLFEVTPSPIDRENIAKDVALIYSDFNVAPNPLTFAGANSDNKFDTGYVKKGVLPAVIDSTMFGSPVGTFVAPYQFGNAWYMAKLLGTQERPDSMQGRHLLVTWEGTGASESVKRTKDQAKKRADSLALVLKAAPDRYEELVRQLSDFPTAKEDGGELKWFRDGDVNFNIFFESGLTMKPNDIKVIETGIGYSVFRLTGKTSPLKKVKAAIVQRNIEPSSQTFQDTYLKASAFAGQNKTQAAFDTAAVKQGLVKRLAQSVKAMDNQVQGVQNAREMVRWAFAETTKTGEVSPVFDLSGKYAVAILKDKTEKGLLTLESIKKRIEPSVKNVKKIELMANQIAEKMKTTVDLTALAFMFNAKVDTSQVAFLGQNSAMVGRDPEVLGKLFTLPKGTIQGPLKGNFGVYVVIIDEIMEAPAKEDYTFENMQLQQMFSGRATSSLYDALQKVADIEDNRMRFY